MKTRPEADLVLEGGTVYTMDPLRPRADAVALRAGKIEAVGTAAEMRAYVGPHTRVVELAGRAVTPGLVDGHAHVYGLGKSLEELSLRGVSSEAEAAGRVAKALAGRAAGEWLEGRGWDQNRWSPPAFPTRRTLDAAAPANPVVLRRIDGHALWTNGAGLAAAGVTRATADPPGGRIERDAAGEPTGVLIDNAMALVEDRVPPPSAEVRRRRLLAAIDAAVAAGLTGVHDMGIDDAQVEDYRQLAAAGQLKLRIYAYLDGVERAKGRKPDADASGEAHFVLRGVKLIADGALGSRGASLLEPYRDDPKSRGLVLVPPAELARAAEICVRDGWQLAVHAIGDRANRDVLDAVAAARVPPAARFRIEHAQVVAPTDVPRFAALGVAASMQPTHATSDMPWAEERLGPERIRGAYAWRTLLAAGARLIGGSDFPIEEVSPLLGLYAAVTRGGWRVEERLTLDEALHMFTVAPAWASFVEHRRGQIAPGFVADLTVLDRDLVADRGLLDTRVDLTIVGGVIVYDRAR